MNGNNSTVSDYLQYLPATLQSDLFLGQFLRAFEQVLTGKYTDSEKSPGILRQDIVEPLGLEVVLNAIHTYFDPEKTPDEFLPWLAGWIALSLRDDWEEQTKRQFIRDMVPLYQLRGTRAGLEKILSLYLKSLGLPDKVTIFELDGFPAHYFQVQLGLPKSEQSVYWRQVRIAKAIIEQEKPAHTYYGLKILTPTMRLTGKRFAIALQQASSIKAIATQQNTPTIRLRLSIKANGVAKPYASNISSDRLEVTYTITPEQFTANPNWYIVIDNLSDHPFTGTLTVQIANQTLFTKTFTPNAQTQLGQEPPLEPGLQIITLQPNGKIKGADGSTRGNTVLGTQSGS
ncbi:hypothetical protein H6G64_32570 [Calothrix sp. FACHB-156]|nr:hypothetical protein [Calothrix sp. FACHB-156]